MGRIAPLGIDDSDPWADLRATAVATLAGITGDSAAEEYERSAIRRTFEDVTGELLP